MPLYFGNRYITLGISYIIHTLSGQLCDIIRKSKQIFVKQILENEIY